MFCFNLYFFFEIIFFPYFQQYNKNNKEKRFWIELTKNHFTKTQYDLGLNKCLNKIDLLIN